MTGHCESRRRRKLTRRLTAACVAVAVMATASGSAQPANQPLAINHYHLTVSDLTKQKQFWVTTLGGRPGAVIPPSAPGTPPFYAAFPNILIGLIPGKGIGGTRGSTIDHLGFQVASLRTTLDKLKAGGYPAVTRSELPSSIDVKDDIGYVSEERAQVAFVMAPDDILVEFIENKSLKAPVAFHHVHLVVAPGDVMAMKQWYIKTFNGSPGRGAPAFESVDMPGVPHTFRISPATGTVVPTEGRVLGHFGFEARAVRALTTRFEGMGIPMSRPLMKFPPNVEFGFITDPWGTSIEVSEHPSGTFFDQALYKTPKP